MQMQRTYVREFSAGTKLLFTKSWQTKYESTCRDLWQILEMSTSLIFHLLAGKTWYAVRVGWKSKEEVKISLWAHRGHVRRRMQRALWMSAGFEHNVTVQMFWCLVFLKYKLTFDLGHPVSGIHAESVILTEMSQLAPYLSVRCHVNKIQSCLSFFQQ